MGLQGNVAPATLKLINEIGCSDDCSKQIPVNAGLPLPCKEWDDIESGLLRILALEDDQLFASGFVTKVPRSSLHDNLRVKRTGIDIGPIRTEASGARKKNECKYNYDGIEYNEFQKKFYTVNTNKHLKICPRDLIGTQLSDLVGDQLSDYDPENFADTDLADLLVGLIIEKYRMEFVAIFILLAVFDAAGENQHGDDGIFAKAWFQHKNQFFHTFEYDLSEIVTGDTLNAIVGGKQYSEAFDTHGSLTALITDFVDFLNGLQDRRQPILNASFDDSTFKVVVAANSVTQKIDLRIVVNQGMPVDWGPLCTRAEETVPVCLQNAMLINDTPLMFRFEEITESNFATLFKKYIKEFVRYMHRNGFSTVTIDSIMIGIDPELMLERNDAINCKIIDGGTAPDFMTLIGLGVDKFKPLNALSGTGLFFMTVPGNIQVFDDAGNDANGIPGLGRVKVGQTCEDEVKVIFDNPIGSSLDHAGLFAANLCESWFVNNNDLDNKEPYENTIAVLSCFDSNTRKPCIIGEATCSISSSVDYVAVYDSGADTTAITVTVNAFSSDPSITLVYDLAYTTSEGTADDGISSASFVITLPGDQTETGIVVTVHGKITGNDAGGDSQCTHYVTDTEKFGDGVGSVECTHAADGAGTETTAIEVEYTINGGGAVVVPLTNAALSLIVPGDYPAIELEIEAILPGTVATITNGGGPNAEVSISGVPSFIDGGMLLNTAGVNLLLVRDC